MKRKILLLTTAVLIGMASEFAQAVEINGIYNNLSGTSATVTSHPSSGYAGNIVIPNTVTYNTVTYTVTSIGGSAFANSNIISVTISTSVTSIGNAAFNGCLILAEVEIKGGTNISLTFLGAGYSNPGSHFENSGIKILKLGRNLTTGYTNNVPNNISPFKGCEKLENVTIGNDVTDINDESYYDCEKLQFLNLGNKLKTIGSYAFFNCPNLESPLTLYPNSSETE